MVATSIRDRPRRPDPRSPGRVKYALAQKARVESSARPRGRRPAAILRRPPPSRLPRLLHRLGAGDDGRQRSSTSSATGSCSRSSIRRRSAASPMLSHWLPFLFFSVLVGRARRPLRSAAHHPDRHGCCSWPRPSAGACCSSPTRWRCGTPRRCSSCTASPACSGTLAAQLLIHDIVGTRASAERGAPHRDRALARAAARPGGGRRHRCSHSGRRTVCCSTRSSICRSCSGCGRRPTGRASGKARLRRCARCKGSATSCPRSRDIAGNRTIVSMILLAGVTSFFVGNGYQPQMPEFAHDLGHGDPDLSYSMLLAADAAGALCRGFPAREPRPAAGRTAHAP